MFGFPILSTITVGFWQLIVIEIVVDIVEFLCLWRLSTGGFPWSFNKSKGGKYVKISDFDSKSGRFKGAVDFSVDEILGLGDRSIMQYQMGEKDKYIKKLELEKQNLELRIKLKESEAKL